MKTHFLHLFKMSAIACCAFSISLGVQAKPPHKDNKHGSLPPGLQKKQARGQSLPPGWQKKLKKGAILDVEVYRHAKVVVPVDKQGLITISIDDRLLRLDKVTRKIISILK